MEKLKLDMHTHTNYSHCSNLTVDQYKKIYKKKGITPIVTDHNTMKGAFKVKPIIMAEEIRTKDGDLLGYFMNEEIPPNLSVEETIDRLKEQDAFISVAHSFDYMRTSSLHFKKYKHLLRKIDAIEIFNGRNMFNFSNRKAESVANKFGKMKTLGTDAHYEKEVGRSYILIDPFDSKKEFVRNLKKAMDARSYVTNKNLWIYFAMSKIKKLAMGNFR